MNTPRPHKILGHICIILCTLFLISCSNTEYHVPTLQKLGLPSDEVILTYHIEREWWKKYKDPKLNILLEKVMLNNIDIQNAITALVNAQIVIKNATGNFIPSAVNNSIRGTFPPKNLYESHELADTKWTSSFGLSLDLSFWQNLPNLRAATWQEQASLADLESVRLAVINSIIDTYFTIQYQQALLILRGENIEFLEGVLKAAQQKEALGKVDGLEPLTARQSLITAKSQHLQTKVTIKDNFSLLRTLLNVNHITPLDLGAIDLIAIETQPINLDIPIEMLAHRPDVKSAEYKAFSALQILKKSHMNWLPSLTIQSGLNLGKENITNVFDDGVLNSGIGLTLPFLNWWNLKWEVKSAENDMEQSLNILTATVNNALNEVDKLYFNYEKQTQLSKLAKEQSQIDKEIFFYRKVRYEVGRDDLQKWLEANTSANNSLESLILSKFTLLEMEHAIYKAMGGMVIAKKK